MSCEGHCYNYLQIDIDDWIQFGILLIALSTLLFYVIQDNNKKRKILLHDELENLVQYINKKELSRPKYKELQIFFPKSLSHLNLDYRDRIFNISNDLSVYDSFYEFVRTASFKLKGTEFTLQQIIDLYNIFTKNLQQRDYLDQTFQILYSCIHNSLSSCERAKYKKDRIERIQNSLTSKQLIYYFFNQINYAGRQREYNQYINELYQYEFFAKMFVSDAYKEIENQIPISVEKLFYKCKNK